MSHLSASGWAAGLGERVVDDDAHAVAVRDRARRRQVGDAQHRVGRRLDEQHFVFGVMAGSMVSSRDVST